MLITLIVLGVINFLLIAPLLYLFIKIKRYNKKFKTSFTLATKYFGYIISLSAPIRTGKSSLQSGLKHIYEIEMVDKIETLFKNTITYLRYINFNVVDEFLKENLSSFNDFDLLTDELLNYLDLNDDLLYDSISIKSLREMLYDYIYAYYVLNYRKNFVSSKTKIYSHITGNFNLEYNVENQKIFESLNSKTYDIEDYMVELVDEVTDEFGAGKYYSDIKDESGAKEYRRKYGQFHKETNRMITTKQDAFDEIKKYRNLNNTEIEIVEKVQLVRLFNYLILNIIEIFFKIFYLLKNIFIYLQKRKYRIMFTFQEFLDYKYKNFNFFKTVTFKFLILKSVIDSFGYCSFKIKIYSNNSKVGTDDYFFEELFIPSIYCFGTYNPFEFRSFQNYLLKESNCYSVETLRYETAKLDNSSIKNEKGIVNDSLSF